MAERHELDADWVNARATPFLPVDFDPVTATVVFDGVALTVVTPPADTIFLMKLDRASAQDREDMILLWPHCTFSTAEDTVARFAAAFPHAPDDPHLVRFVEGVIFDAAL